MGKTSSVPENYWKIAALGGSCIEKMYMIGGILKIKLLAGICNKTFSLKNWK
ncbi:hypothetical protein AB8U03_02925 [Clostridium sp. Mt-5]|uniref:Uncharacterized protein n=1 Tax=Clostridium moutaii TaxID=3240932 RepID=A0ABV4BK52_9CLOT